MNAMSKAIALSAAVAVCAVPVTAHADDGGNLSTDAPTPAFVTQPSAGAKGPKLKFTGRTPKHPAAERNNERYAGASPAWVQPPVLQKKKGKYSLYASATVRAFKRQGVHTKSAKDKVTLKVSVFKRHKTANEAQATYTKRESVKVTKHGLVSVRVPVSKRAAKYVKTLQQQRDRIIVSFIHAKDTYPAFGRNDDFQQVLSGEVTKKVLTPKQTKRQIALDVRAQRRIEAGKSRRSAAGARLSAENQVYYYTLFVYNNTPFQQAVNFNPNIACMSVADTGTGGSLITTNVTLSPMVGTVQLLANPGPNPDDPSMVYDQWYGANDGNPPSNVGSEQTSLVQSGRDVLNNIQANLWDPEAYTEAGLETGALATGLTFGVNALVQWIESQNTCSSYGQYWGITSTALQVGVDDSNEVTGNPAVWATGYSQTPGDTTQADGQPVVRSVAVGETSLMANALPAAGSPSQQSLSAIMNSAVGQQSQSTYFHNAGMPAPIANAAGNAVWSGMTNFSQGLIQYVYPNPGSCPNNDCNEGQTGVQLGYLVENYDQVVGPELYSSPTATVSTGINANTGQTNTIINCTVPSNGEFNNPFGGSPFNPAAANDPELGSLAGMSGVQNAGFYVSYYAQDAAGNYLFSSSSAASGFPGSISSPPALNAAAGGTQLLAMNQTSADAPALYLAATDVSNLIDPSTGESATPVSYGCAVTPVISWSNMSVTPGSQWGGNWPFPQTQENGPLSSPLQNTANWANNVNAINLTWTGDLYVSQPVAAP